MSKKTKLIAAILALTTIYLACSQAPRKETKETVSQPPQAPDKIDTFWIWFQANQKDLRDLKNNRDTIVSQIFDHIRMIESGLAVELAPPKNDTIELTVSADGDRNLFPAVEKIIAKAPKIDGWKFFAFRQRVPKEKMIGIGIKTKDFDLNVNDMKFYPMISGDTLDIIIYAKNVTEDNYNQIAYSGLILLDNVLGEYDCVKKVRKYDFQNMPTKKEELKDLRPLSDLPAYVDSFHNAKH